MVNSGLKWMFLIIGTTIGAGYASGREIWEFFGHGSGLAILIFVILFSLSSMFIMQISFERKTTEYRPVLEKIVGKRVTPIYDLMLFIYLYTTTVVMISGSGATGQTFHLSYWTGITFIVIALVLLFINGIGSLLYINQYLLPIMIIGLVYVLIIFSIDEQLTFFAHWREQHNWLAAFPFTALNILPLVAVLGAVGHQIKSKQEIWIASFGSGIILGIVSYLYNTSLIQISDDLILYEIPLFAILKGYPFQMVIWMSVLLWFAIYTTAAAGLLGIVTRVRSYFKLPLWVLVTITLCTMIPMTMIGFSTLIRYTYPLYGILNLYILAKLILYPIWQRT